MLLACQTEDSFLITNIYLHSTYSVFINVVLIHVAYVPTHKNAKKLLFHQTYSSFNSSKTQGKKGKFSFVNSTLIQEFNSCSYHHNSYYSIYES